MNATFKPCPFCGSHAELEYEGKEIPDGENWLHIVCSNCGGSSGYYMSAESARRAWNMRSDSYKP